LGYSQYPFLNLVQFVEFTGVYGVSALVIFGNLVVFTLLTAREAARWRLLGIVVVLVLVLSSWGAWRRTQLAALPPAQYLRIALLQGNIAQDQKWDKAFEEEILNRYERLSREAAAQGAQLIVWPETAFPFYFQSDFVHRERLLDLVRELRTPLLFGAVGWQHKRKNEVTLFNRAYLLSASGEELGSYDKIKLAPFGEYIPFHNSLLFFLDKLVVGIGDFGTGTEAKVFELPLTRFGVLICYEGIFPDFARQFVANGAQLLINITNDAWFGRSSAPSQHLVMEAMRAIENRVPLVRAANTGFSAVIANDGHIQAQTALYETTTLLADLAWPQANSFYASYGDVFVYLCVLTTLGMLGYSHYRQSR
jgi:apolipoprotein N-acyltransferase